MPPKTPSKGAKKAVSKAVAKGGAKGDGKKRHKKRKNIILQMVALVFFAFWTDLGSILGPS